MSVHLPVGLLALALAVFLAAQIGAASQGSKTMDWQLQNLDKQLAQLMESKDKMEKLLVDREPVVAESKTVLDQYTKLFNEVLDLAKTDPDAARIVEKWKITRSAPPEADAAGDKEKPAATP